MYICHGFPDSSVGKEAACNAGDPGSIPGSRRSPGEGTGCPLQYSWPSLVAQLVKNLPATWETWETLIPGFGCSPGEGKGYLLQYSGLEFHGVTKSWTWLSDFHFSLSPISSLNLPLHCSQKDLFKRSIWSCYLLCIKSNNTSLMDKTLQSLAFTWILVLSQTTFSLTVCAFLEFQPYTALLLWQPLHIFCSFPGIFLST